MKKSQAGRAITIAGLTAGILDISSAFVIWTLKGVGLTRGLQGIASGVLGPDSFQHGLATVALGLALHFLIAFGATTVFYAASRMIPWLTRRPVVSGFLYGIAVYLVMYWMVVPLSAAKMTHSISKDLTAVIIHMFLVGLPIALLVSRYAPPQLNDNK
jgi:hypothetical protein